MELTIEIALLTACALPLLRLNVQSSFVRSFPDLAILLSVFLITGVVAVTALCIWSPVLLRPVTLICVTLFVALWYRARERYGASKGLPPGSLSLARTFQAITDQNFFLETARRLGPIFKFNQFHRPAVCVVGLDKGSQLLKTHAGQLRTAPLPFNASIPGGFIRYMEPNAHRNYSLALRSAFTPAILDVYREDFQQAIRNEVEVMAASCDPQGFEPANSLKRMSSACLVHALFGLHRDDPRFLTLLTLCETVGTEVMTRPNEPRIKDAFDNIESIIESRKKELKARVGAESNERENVLQYFASSDAAHLDPQTVLKNLLFLFLIGSSNTTGLLRWVLQQLGDHPQWVTRIGDQLRQGNESRAKELAKRVVRETLRLHQSEYIYRTVNETFVFDNLRFPRGWLVRVAVRESHRDERIFDNPERFDPDRFERHDFEPRQFSPFGLDHHMCVGAAMASCIAELLVEELARKGTWRVVADGPVARRRRHWQHWETSPSLRIVW